MLTNIRIFYVSIILYTVFWSTSPSVITEFEDSDEESNEADGGSYDEDPYFLQVQGIANPDPQYGEPQETRVTRQKACKWTGCHRLPLGKDKKTSCPSGTYLESYEICKPRGNGNVNVQCCNE